jgi:hypothetical protein
MSWSVRGVRKMAKIRELVINGEIGQWCGRSKQREFVKECMKGEGVFPVKSPKRGDDGDWLEAGVPILFGPLASSPWVKELRTLIYRPFAQGR